MWAAIKRWLATGDPVNWQRCRTCDRVGPEVYDRACDDCRLPEGLWRRPDGRIMYECRSCEQAVEFYGDPADGFDPETAYCGGSPRCLP